MTKQKKQEKKEEQFDKQKKYSITDAIELAKEMSKVKFDESLEVHFLLGIDPKKGDQQIRGAVNLHTEQEKALKSRPLLVMIKLKNAKKPKQIMLGMKI